jgi:hypothetical protein
VSFATLWELAESWPCDYALVTTEGNGKRPATSIKLHLDKCRKCTLKKKLLEIDEKLKRIAAVNYEQFTEGTNTPPWEVSVEAFEAIREHAQVMRDEFIGAPKG